MKISHIPIFLSIISIAMLLTGFKKPAPSITAPQALHKGIWSIPIGIGMSWKPKAEPTDHA
ncbi:MAG: hypothetical protein V3581_02905 [Candidatus Cardinium sp.]|nr:hypothetical protein [Candidatus Cardinium sp. TP]MDN5247287.1 hypothetical protein [Candidatus Cardinium sp.]